MNETGAGKIDTGRLMRQATYASVGVALILIGAKLFAYLMTDSVSLLSTLLDSLLDAAASLVNLVAVRTALTPADAEHRFGHGKAEPLAALGQSAFIAGSALFLLVEAGNRVVNPSPIQNSGIGLAVMVFSIAATFLLVLYQRHVIRLGRSLPHFFCGASSAGRWPIRSLRPASASISSIRLGGSPEAPWTC